MGGSWTGSAGRGARAGRARMRRLQGWLWGAATFLLLGGSSGSGSTNHSFSLLWAGVSESGLGLSWFITLGYLDDVLLGAYNSDGKRIVPRVPWVEKWSKEFPQNWQKETKIARTWLFEFQWLLEKVQNVYNHSQGLHVLQLRISCELKADGQGVGHFRAAYDRRDIMAFDMETFSWTAVETAKDIPNLWRAFAVPHVGAFLTVDCFEWLRKHLHSGKEVLRRREPPVVKATHKKSRDGLETLLCQAHGFYPKEIEATWRKDGEGRQGNMSHGVVSPNADGTYYAWISIEIDPKERSHYQCHVEHDGLQDPLDVAVEESALVPLGLVVGITLMSGILLLIGIVLYISK